MKNSRRHSDGSVIIYMKYFDAAIIEGNRSEADKRYKEAVKAVDQAAARGLLHKNTAANRKSKMTLRLNKIPQ